MLKNENYNSPEYYALMHNNLCDYTEESIPYLFNNTHTSVDTIKEWMLTSPEFFYSNDFSQEEVLTALGQTIDYIELYGDDSQTGKSNLLLSLKENNAIIQDQLIQYYSQDFVSAICEIFDITRELEVNQEELQLSISNFENMTIEDDAECFARDVFCEVFNYSNEYWTAKVAAAGDPPAGMTCEEWVIAMDALGALLGLPFGPVGSIIMSAYMSIGASRECNDS
jgi:hypothetical protein